MGEMRIVMGNSLRDKHLIDPDANGVVEAGDTKITWDKDNKKEVDAARKTFDNLTKQGYTAFKVTDNDETSYKLANFSPDVERIVFIAPMAGG